MAFQKFTPDSGADLSDIQGASFTSQSAPAAPPTLGAGARKKLGIKRFAYPVDVGSTGQGHYILFMIHSLKEGKLKKGAATAGSGRGGVQKRSFTLKGSTKRVDTMIQLYMPPSVEVSYKSDYEDVEIGVMAEAGGKAIGAALQGDFSGAGKSLARGAAEGATKGALTAADTVAPGAAALAQIKAGKIQSSKMELAFKGVGRRQFSYTFSFIPKSAKESQSVDAIIMAFKRAMLPKYTSGAFGQNSDKTLTIPTTFDIEYFFQDGTSTGLNNFLNRISTCYLTDMSVKYGGDRYTAYEKNVTAREGATNGEGTPPQRSEISLTFNEIEIITQESVELGF